MPPTLSEKQDQQKPDHEDSHRRADKRPQQNVLHVGAVVVIIHPMPRNSFRTFRSTRLHRRQKLRRRHLMPIQRRNRKRPHLPQNRRRLRRLRWLRVTTPGLDIHHRMPARVIQRQRVRQRVGFLHEVHRNEKKGHPEGWPKVEAIGYTRTGCPPPWRPQPCTQTRFLRR